MNIINIRKFFKQIRLHTALIQGRSIIFICQIPSYAVCKKVQSSRM